MANLTEVATSYPAAIYQLETTDPVLGGAGGLANAQAQALANRTAYLKAFMDSLCGVPFPYLGSTAPAGFVMASGRTIGSASSGATERANADTQALFTLLWNSMANTEAPVSGGRGASAAADWAANKTITLPDMRGRVPAGKDNMGGTAAGRLTTAGAGVDGATLGAAGGSQTHTLTTAQMPAHTHANTLSDPGHTHSHNAAYNAGGSSTGGGAFGLNAPGGATINAATTGISINNASQGSGAAHPITQPTYVTNWIIKL